MTASARRRRLTALLTALLVLAAPATAQAARGLSLGFFDGVFLEEQPVRDWWLGRARAVHADILRINIAWPAPNTATRPPNFDARDPADPRYDFGRADAAVVAARARGLQVLLSFAGAPAWVDGPGRPAGVTPGTWKPSPRALEDLGAALARRYSGSFPDPARPGRRLPRVKAFQPWNEPNLDKYLNPQWNGRRAWSPILYRRMLTAFHRGVKSVNRRALVVSAGTAPFGDPQPGGRRVMPALFWRDLLCVRDRYTRLSVLPCPNPARFDVLSHHPYSVGRPRRRALNDDDVSIPDMRKLTRVLRFAERKKRALGRKRHRIWVTEVSYDSSPPDPDGIAEATHARYVAETFYVLWRQGVDTITWFQIRDQAPVPSYAGSNQSGVYFRDGRAKRAAGAFRFPFVAERKRGGKLRVWGRSPRAGRVRIERRRAGRWRLLRTARVRRNGTFFLSVARIRGVDRLRARVGNEKSMSWTQR